MKLATAALTLTSFVIASCGSTPIPVNGPLTPGSIPDGGQAGGPDGGPDGGGGATGSITCGEARCDSATQDCCVSFQGASCGPRGSCTGASLSCSSAASCPDNEVCCVELQGQISAACAPACGSGVQLCASDRECPSGLACRTNALGYDTCAPTGGPGSDGGGFGGRDGGGFGGRDGGGFGRDGGSAQDAGPDTGLTCGNTSCDPATQDCCVSSLGARCGARGSCPGGTLSCTSPTACTTGQVCCATFGANGALHASCADTCSSDGGFAVRLCTSNDHCPEGVACQPSLFGVRTCGFGG
jgi:hypothetical protein